MTKEELIWLLIRIAGLYFLAKGLLLALEILAGILIMLTSDTPQVFRDLSGVYTGTLIRSLAFSALGLYLINGGGSVYRALAYRPPERE